LRQTSSLFGFHSHTHRDEHSLEVQLPFLQMILDKFVLVPIVMADQSLANAKDIAAALVKVLSLSNKERTVVVASSDLYHGGSYEECKARDGQLAAAVGKFNAELFMEGIEQDKYMACGAGPIAVIMLTAKGLGATEVKILHRTNSYDANPINDSYVVGYLSAVYY
jgi:AmmeMemoRadiSam system protein B